MADTDHQAELLTLTADIAAEYLGNNNVAVSDVELVIQNIYRGLSKLSPAAPTPEPKREPAVSVRASIKPDFIVCLEDGKKLKMLKRHLMTHYQMTPAEYRAKWNLPADYPMVAPSYAEQRRGLAKKIGLGRRPRKPAPAPAPEPQPTSPSKRGRRKAAAPEA